MTITLRDVGSWSPLIWSIMKKQSVSEAAVYSIVWSYAQMKNKECRIPIDKFVDITGIGRRTIQKCLTNLCNTGYIKKVKVVNNSTNHYIITGKAGIKEIAWDHEDDQIDDFDVDM